MTGVEDLKISKTEVRSFLLYCKKDRNLGTVSLRMYYWKVKGLFTFLTLPALGSKKIMRVLSQDESTHLLETVVAPYQALPANHLMQTLGKAIEEFLQLQEQQGQSKVGIGLMNVHNRLKFIYGEAYGISIHSEMNQGTEVLIILPDLQGGDSVA